MRVLIVKLSSLGDVVHAFPAVTDAARAIPGLELDWAVDEAFAPLARLHPAVGRVIALPIRRLKKSLRSGWPLMRERIGLLRERPYDLVIDAQGLVKSAVVTRLAAARSRQGFGRGSAREGWATLAYDIGHPIPETEHMAVRIRRLFAASLGYPMPDGPPDAGLVVRGNTATTGRRRRLVFIHGTSWRTKTWTVEGWRMLARLGGEAGFEVTLFAHGADEIARAGSISAGFDHVSLHPPADLAAIIPVVADAAGVVTVDTGLGHLAAAFGIPTIGLYGPTNPGLTGLVGPSIREFVATRSCAPCERSTCRIKPDFGEGPPCLADHVPEQVWLALRGRLRV